VARERVTLNSSSKSVIVGRNNVKHGQCISVLGTGSDVGKSIVATALCRIFFEEGVSVAPFKAQNMSNNSFVTVDGGEMGRAQVVQAEAACVEPSVDMNPVLLKPSADITAQVVLHGKIFAKKNAREYFKDTDFFFAEAQKSLARLRSDYDLVVMEGAGSCAEVNLMKRDFANLRMAEVSDADVILVADIDRGGVFAQIIGTLEVLPEEDRKRIKGFIINRFRGDPELFKDGIAYIEERTGIPVLGLIPFFKHIEIDSEDGLFLDKRLDPPDGVLSNKVNIAVLRLPHISNFTDFGMLDHELAVNLNYLSKPRDLDGYDILMLPGTKNVRFDAAWLNETGWSERIRAYVKNGGRVGGICGGYQMLGKVIYDPHGVEGEPGETLGLGLLDIESTLSQEKKLSRSSGIWYSNGEKVEGYEIHMGVTTTSPDIASVMHLQSCNGVHVDTLDGAVNSDGKVWGTYLHGLFDMPGFRKKFLQELRPGLAYNTTKSVSLFRDRQYALLAEHFREYLDMPKLIGMLGIKEKHMEQQ